MKLETVVPAGVFDTRANHYSSPAIRAGNAIYVSGQVAWDQKGALVAPADMEAQTRQCLDNMRRTVEAGGARMSDVVRLMVWVRDIRDFTAPEVAGLWREYFGDRFPTLAVVQISNLWRPDFMLSIEGIAEPGPKQVIVAPDVFDSRPGLYSQAIRAGNTIYVSAQLSLDERGNIVGRGDFGAQMGMSMENQRRILKAAGASMDQMVFMHMFSKDERHMHRPSYETVWREYLGQRDVACTSIQYGNLQVRGALTAFDGVAEIGPQEIIVPPDVADSVRGQLFPQAIKVNNKVYVSGQVPWDINKKSVGQGNIEAQTRMVYENMKRTLKAAGAAMSDVVKVGVFVKDIRLLRRGDYGKIFKEYFGEHCPAVNVVQVDNFWRSDYMLEIEAIAAV
ncbi:MAG: hypothetical protein HY673_21595 [Chloroflexi bacterium]|nr:hypothetical protein [Chloroflexota bacterium]